MQFEGLLIQRPLFQSLLDLCFKVAFPKFVRPLFRSGFSKVCWISVSKWLSQRETTKERLTCLLVGPSQ